MLLYNNVEIKTVRDIQFSETDTIYAWKTCGRSHL